MALVLRAVKGSPLTITEMDGNFTHLNERFTDLNATNLKSGTLPDARLSNNVVFTSRSLIAGDGLSGGGNLSSNKTINVDNTVLRTSGTQTASGAKTFNDRLTLNGGVGINSTAGVLVVRQNGNTYTSGMTITSGHTTYTRIWKDSSGTTHISSSNTTGGISISTTGVVSTVGNLNVGGSLSGNGSSLTALNASNLSSGTVPTARLSGTYGINITGSAGSASSATTAARLENGRRISLTGDLSGSAWFDGNSNISISAAVANNSHTHSAANITSGTFDLARIPTSIARTSGDYLTNTKLGNYVYFRDYDDGNAASGLRAYVRNNTWNITPENSSQGSTEIHLNGNQVYHEGHKPTTGEIGAVPTGRNIATGTGLSGGGNLTTNRTLSVDSTVVRQRRIYNSGSQTLSGSGYKKTTWLNWSNSPTITIDGSSFMDDSEIKIVNQKGGGTITISCNDGIIYTPDGLSSSTHTISAAGTVHMIKFDSVSWMAQIY